MFGIKTPVRTEMKRTCKRCGTVRYVALVDAKLKIPEADDLASARKWGAIGAAFGGSQSAAVASRMTSFELELQRATAAVQCPQCGSQSFSQEEVPI